LEREEEERLQREAEEKERADEERRQRMAEEKAEREAERKKLDEQAAKQRAKEEAIEAKLAARKQQAAGIGPRVPSREAAAAAPPSPAGPVGAESERASGPPRLNLSRPGGGPSWREKQAMKAAAEPSAPSEEAKAPAPEESAPKKAGGYVPPARAGTADRWRPREGSGRGGRDESPATAPTGRFGASRGGRDMAERTFSGRGRDRGESPAAGAASAAGAKSGYVPPHLRGERREASPADSDGGAPPPRPPPAQGASADGKYRPGAFRRTGA